MAVYFIVEIKIKHKDTYVQYIEKVRPIVKKYSGRYLARGGKITPFFGNWNPERIVIIQFPSARGVKRWLASKEYKEILALRENSTLTKAIMDEGERS